MNIVKDFVWNYGHLFGLQWFIGVYAPTVVLLGIVTNL